jgi:Tfp pilus assembly protein PilF/peroxiredoxin
MMRRARAVNDVFPTEVWADELRARLDELFSLIRGRRFAELPALLAPGFRGTPLAAPRETEAGPGPHLRVFRGEGGPVEPRLEPAAFHEALSAYLADCEHVRTTDFQITRIAPPAAGSTSASIAVDYDIAGTGEKAWRVHKAGQWEMEWLKGPDSVWRVARWTAHAQTRSQASAPVFRDVTAAALGHNPDFHRQFGPGVDYWRVVIDGALAPDIFGNNGVAAADVDGDGLDDFYVCQTSGLPNRLYRNQGDGTFADVTEASGVGILDSTSMAIFVDVDNDGDQDLIVSTWKKPLLFLNGGGGRFAEKPGAFGLEHGMNAAFVGAAVADFDRDGFLDIYFASYTYFQAEGKYRLASPYHDARNGSPNALFRNDGNGGFVDVTEATGLNASNDRYSFQCAWADFDQDGWPDLAVTNDYGRKNLYHSNGRTNGQVTFTDVTAAAGVNDHQAGMSVSWLDYDNDGLLDIYAGQMWTAAGLRVTDKPEFQPRASGEVAELYRRHSMGNSLLRNRGDGTFEDVSRMSGTKKGRWAWSCDPLDLDSDGWQDIYVANGFVTNTDAYDLDSFFWRQVVGNSALTEMEWPPYEDGWRAINRMIRGHGSWNGRERNVFFYNDGAGRFVDVAGALGLDFIHDGRAFAVSDFDRDGDPDMVLVGRTGPQVRLLRNDFPGEHAQVAFRLTGRESNRDAIGALVTVETDRGLHVKPLQAGSGFLSQHSKEVLFGLGASRTVRRASITWPSGLRQDLEGVKVGQRVFVVEGREPTHVEPFASIAGVPGSPPEDVEPSAPAERRTWFYEPYAAPAFQLTDLAGAPHRLADLEGQPVLLNFFATWSPPSREDLKELQDGFAELRTAGAELLAVSVDEPQDAEAVRRLARDLGLRFPVLLPDHEVIGAYNLLNRYLFDRHQDLEIPSTFLIDGLGQVVRLYRGSVRVGEMASDLKQLSPDPEARLARALPFRGRFVARPPGRNFFQFGVYFSEQGYDRAAISAFEAAVRLSPGLSKAHYNLGTLHMREGDLQAARTALDDALRVKPDFPEALNNLGSLLAQQGDRAGAISRFEAALKSRPEFPEALNNLGFAHLQDGREAEAEPLIRRALELDPDLPEADNYLGILYGNRGDLTQAEAHFRAAVAKRRGYSEAANNLAMVLAGQDRVDEAIPILEAALEEDPDFETSYVTLVRLHLKARRTEAAVRVLDRLLQRKPGHPQASELLSRLKGTS